MIINPGISLPSGGGIQISATTRVGKGKYGAGNKITLTFDFKPEVVFITNPDTGAAQHMAVWLRGMTTGDNGYTGRTVVLEWGERAVSWYSTTTGVNGSAYLHMDGLNETYNIIALGD